jgi:nitronate monooxygenase
MINITPYALPGMELTVPVVQATLGPCDCPRLAAAVSEAGGLGTLSFYKPTIAEVESALIELRSLTQKPVLLSLLGDWENPGVLEKCFEYNIKHFQVQWWNGSRLISALQKANAFVFWQVGSLQQATEAFSHAPDAFILPGTESGGPVRTSYPALTLLALMQANYPNIPLIAGGGLATSSDVASIVNLGATAALLGTRFLLSEEAQATPEAKEHLRRANNEQLFLDTQLLGNWPCAPRRRLLQAPDTSDYFAGTGIAQMQEILPAAQIVQSFRQSFRRG